MLTWPLLELVVIEPLDSFIIFLEDLRSYRDGFSFAVSLVLIVTVVYIVAFASPVWIQTFPVSLSTSFVGLFSFW